jgi:hypothetical protein
MSHFPRELPDLEQTLGDLMLDLLRAKSEYNELVLAAPLDGLGRYSPEAVRVTQHYTMALLAYGYTPYQIELQEAAGWFSTTFPTESNRRIDALEMNRLEVLLELRPHDPMVLTRLEQLAQQHTSMDTYDLSMGDPLFETLWTLKVMAQARKAGVLNGIMPDDELKRRANAVVQGQRRDKDLALALRLRHDLAGKLTAQQQTRYLQMLMQVARDNGSVWGVTQDMRWMAESMWRGQITPGQVADNRDVFREMILSTCYVIENLLPLAPHYPEIEPVLRQAMEVWWGIFHGSSAVDFLHALFPNAYDYLLIVCRTIVSLRAYLDEPLLGWGAAHIYRTMAQQNTRQIDSPDNENIKKALKDWIKIDFEKMPESLRKGMSGTNIVRIHPQISTPSDTEDREFSMPLPNASSLVVKYGAIEEIDRERENFAHLPAGIRECFVTMPQPSYIDERRRKAYIIMADLSRHKTLAEMLEKVPQLQPALNRELMPFLIRMHMGDLRQRRAAGDGLLLQLYLLPMQEHVRRVFSYILENRLLESDKVKENAARRTQRGLLDAIGHLVRRQLDLEGFPLACMHGDLHTRNIMVKKLRPADNPDRDTELDFKLIDLEKFERSGDAALDAGELLMDMEILRAPRNTPADKDPIALLMKGIRNSYNGFAEERGDQSFGLRLDLAQARALIRVAKGRTKAGEANLRESRRGPSVRVAYDALDFTEAALALLERVVKQLG